MNPYTYLSKIGYKTWATGSVYDNESSTEVHFLKGMNTPFYKRKLIEFKEKDIKLFQQDGKEYWNVDHLFDKTSWRKTTKGEIRE